MTICPSCGQQNIAGADACDGCGSSLAEVSNYQPTAIEEEGVLGDRISVLTVRPPMIAEPDTPVGDVLQVLVDNSIGCVLIVEDGEIVGVFSERDALMRLGRPLCRFARPSRERVHDRVARDTRGG